MEKEQVKCELCEGIKEFNADAAEERGLLEEFYKEHMPMIITDPLIEQKFKKYSHIGTRVFRRDIIGVVYREDFDNVRFKYCVEYPFTHDNYIQYCPFCGRKIKQ